MIILWRKDVGNGERFHVWGCGATFEGEDAKVLTTEGNRDGRGGLTTKVAKNAKGKTGFYHGGHGEHGGGVLFWGHRRAWDAIDGW